MNTNKSVLLSIIAAFILVGLFVLTIKNPTLTAYTAYNTKEKPKLCYVQVDERLVPEPRIADCCLSLSNSVGCQAYFSNEILDELYRCRSDRIIVVNKALIDFCTGK